MKLKILTFYISEYVFVFPLYYLHELSHWFVALIFYILGTNLMFPTITVERWYKVEITGKTTTSSTSFYMYIQTQVRNRNYLTSILVTSAPAFLTVVLFIISPWYLCLIYCNNLSVLWLSVGDVTSLEHLFNRVRRARNIKKIKTNQSITICLKS